MDWTEKVEQKKKLRTMARRMLWADFKGVICGWKCILVVALYFFFIALPYAKSEEDFNVFAMSYVFMWVFIEVSALYEKPFNYLPFSTEDIVHYLKYRTNLLEAWVTAASIGTVAVLHAAGEEVFVERGLMMLCFVLTALEGWFFELLYSLAKAQNEAEQVKLTKSRRVRMILYSIYAIVVLFVSMFGCVFMKYDETAKVKLLVTLGLYLVMYIFRTDVSHWVQFRGFVKPAERVVFATQQQNTQNL
ncbi:MAG: hypothetical protein J6K04_04630 [Lachnospiraceae bacterium]|nr:hypothetical protein [Lachnospiraceae bacterium]